MTATELFGYIAQFLFVFGSIGQAVKVYKEGHAEGLAYSLLLPLIIGFGIMLVYVPVVIGWDFVLLSGYSGQFACILFMLYYKVRPRKWVGMEVNLDGNVLTAEQVEEAALKAVENFGKYDPVIWDESKGCYVSVKEKK